MVDKLIWDSDFFNIPIGKYEVIEDLHWVEFEQAAEKYKLTYVFSDFELNFENLKHVDTKLTFRKQVQPPMKSLLYANTDISIRRYGSEFDNYKELEELAYLSGGFSRFRLDKCFENGAFERLYKKWLDESLSGNIADEVLVASFNSKIIGFVSLKIDHEGNGHIGLIAVHPDFHGKKIASNLIRSCENKLDLGKYLAVPTQEANTSALKLYIKNDFRIVDKKYVYHYWQKP